MADTMVLSGVLPEGTPGVDNYVNTGNRCSDEEVLAARKACLRQYEEGKMGFPGDVDFPSRTPEEDLRMVLEMCGLNEGARWAGTKSATHGSIEARGKGLGS